MSLTAIPVTPSDLTGLQTGVQFFTNTSEATSQASAINTPGSGVSVFTYAGTLLNSNISLAQVAMADTAIMEGGTIAVGNTTTPNTLTFLSTQFLPNQVAAAAIGGFNQTVYSAQALGLALASTSGFQSNFGSLNGTAFVTAVANATGVSTSAITTFLANWLAFYTANPQVGLTAQQAAYGATFGDAIGVALINPTSANLMTTFSTNTSNPTNTFSPNVVTGLVANALIGNAEGQYKVGVALGALPAHIPLQGEFVSQTGVIVNLTTGVDTVNLTQSNSTVNGTLGSAGAGSTWTPGDTITAGAGLTNETFNIDGIGNAGVINPTTLTGNTVSGVQTVNVISNTNIVGLPDQAVQGNFTPWTGLTALNVTSGGNTAGVDVLTVGATTAVNVTDSLITDTNAALTVNGSSTTTILENNFFFDNAGIAVNGGTGTTSVSVTQTEGGRGFDGIVTITDVNGASTTAAGTITTVVLDGLTFGNGLPDNTITDNALTTLTVNHTDANGANLDIINNLTTQTHTTLSLALGDNGVGSNGLPFNQFSNLIITDNNNEITTIHLTLGNQNSYATINDNGLVTLDTPTAGTGALVGFNATNSSEINDNVATAVNFNFSGLNGANQIEVDRGNTANNDVFTLGNFGTDLLTAGRFQTLTIDNANANNAGTVNFGSGAYDINVPTHTGGNWAFVNTAPVGLGLNSLGSLPNAPTGEAQWALIAGVVKGDTLQFQDNIQTAVNGATAFATVTQGIAAANALLTPHTAYDFTVTGVGNSFIYDDVSGVNSVTAADSLVAVTGTHTISVNASHILTFTS